VLTGGGWWRVCCIWRAPPMAAQPSASSMKKCRSSGIGSVVAMMPWEYEAVVGNLVDRQVNRRPVDFLDVYALSPSRPYDAILDVFLALPGQCQSELHAPRPRLACVGRLF